MKTSKINEPITNAPILFEENLSLPEISYYAKHSGRFSYPDDPELDGIHIHDDYEIYVHVNGNGAFLVDNNVYPLHRGDVILTKPGDVHVFIVNDASMTEYFCLWLSPACGSRLLAFTHGDGFCPHLTFSEEIGEQLLRLLHRITAEDDRPWELEKISTVLQIVLLLADRTVHTPHAPLPLPEEMKRIIEYVDREFRHISGVGDIATHFNISPATLNRRFRQYIHVSPQEFVKAKRLAFAKKLLDSGATVTESCMQSGFSDCSYFISVFKKKFGETPHSYQRRETSGIRQK